MLLSDFYLKFAKFKPKEILMKKIYFLLCIGASLIANEVIDHNGDKLKIDGSVKRVVVHSGYPLPSVFAIFDGGVDKLVGIPKTSMSAAVGTLIEKVFPKISKIPTDYDAGGAALNVEAVLKLNPDAVFYYADNKVAKDLLKNANLPAIGFGAAIYDNNVVTTYEHWLKLMGELLQKDSKAENVISFAKKTQNDILQKVSKAKSKPTAIIIKSYNNGKIFVSGSKDYAQYWLDTTGAVNGAKDIIGTKEISLEELYKIDPDIIYITNFTTLLPHDIYNGDVKDVDLSGLKAVTGKKVYKFPLGMYRWFPPSSDTPLSLMWLAKHNQPELFKDLKIEDEIKSFYSKFYSIKLDDKDVKNILNPSKKAGDVKL